jgi:hypothetical protein
MLREGNFIVERMLGAGYMHEIGVTRSLGLGNRFMANGIHAVTL